MDKVKGGRAGNTPRLEYLLSSGKSQVKGGKTGKEERKRSLQEMSCQPLRATKSSELKATEVKVEGLDRDQKCCIVIS